MIHPRSSIIQHSPHINNATLREGIIISAILNPLIEVMLDTILKLLSYISRSFSGHNLALNAIMHFPTSIQMKFPYISSVIASTHTLYSMNTRYIDIKNPAMHSVIQNIVKYLIILCLNVPFHIIPSISIHTDENTASNANHSAGNSDITALVIGGDEYVASKPETNKLIKSHFWLLSGCKLINLKNLLIRFFIYFACSKGIITNNII